MHPRAPSKRSRLQLQVERNRVVRLEDKWGQQQVNSVPPLSPNSAKPISLCDAASRTHSRPREASGSTLNPKVEGTNPSRSIAQRPRCARARSDRLCAERTDRWKGSGEAGRCPQLPGRPRLGRKASHFWHRQPLDTAGCPTPLVSRHRCARPHVRGVRPAPRRQTGD